MSLQGIVMIDLAGLALIFLILNLVRSKQLHIGYAVIWFLAAAGGAEDGGVHGYAERCRVDEVHGFHSGFEVKGVGASQVVF